MFVTGGRITFSDAELDDAETVVDGGFLVPGLVDAHAHLALYSPAGDDAPEEERVRASAAAQLAAGVLLVREPGSPGRASNGLGPDSGMALPRVVTAGRLLAPAGRYFPGLNREVSDDELPDAAEEEARLGGGWVKIIGDFTLDGAIRPNYRQDTFTEGVRRAHAAGARVATHVTTVDGVEMAIAAGVDSIEHGQGLRADHLRAMAAQGTVLVPTMSILPALSEVIGHMGLADSFVAEMRATIDRHPEMVGEAVDAGVRVFAGTDAGLVPHGEVAGEIARLAGAGLSPTAALAAGSWAARDYLGWPGIEEGAPADLVAFEDDPRDDLDTLRHPGVTVLAGRVTPVL